MAEGLTPGPAGGSPPFNFGPAPTSPGFDPLDRLPEGLPQDRLRRMRQHRDDQYALTVPFEQVRQASLAKQEAANAHRRLVSHPHNHGLGLASDHPSVKQALKTLERAEAELQLVQQRQAERLGPWQAAAAALANVEGWLKQGVPGTLEPAVIEPPKLLKGETLLDALDRARRRGREIKASLHTVRSAPWPSAHVKRRASEIVERLAARGEPDVTLLLEHDTEISWPSTSHRAEVFGGETRALAFHESVDSLALICFLLRDTVLKRLSELIDESADDAAAMSTEQREKAEAELLGDSVAQDRLESEIVWLLMAQGGGNVEHRSDVAPQAVLGVALKTNKPNGPPPTTSPLVWDVMHPGGGRR